MCFKFIKKCIFCKLRTKVQIIFDICKCYHVIYVISFHDFAEQHLSFLYNWTRYSTFLVANDLVSYLLTPYLFRCLTDT